MKSMKSIGFYFAFVVSVLLVFGWGIVFPIYFLKEYGMEGFLVTLMAGWFLSALPAMFVVGVVRDIVRYKI